MSSEPCTHAILITKTVDDAVSWHCASCLRSFFPSGETRVEQETVRLRSERDELRDLLRRVCEQSVNGRKVLSGIDWAVASPVRLALKIPDPRSPDSAS